MGPAEIGRANPLWTAAAGLTALLALLIGGWAVVSQYLASRPVGEGELFLAEVQATKQRYLAAREGREDIDYVVRYLRNDLEVEAVSVLSSDRRFLASTSPNLNSTSVEGFLADALERRRFVAIAQPIARPINIDGVEQWVPGDILYRVLAPLPEGGGLLVDYDMSALLARRVRLAGVQPLNLAGGALSIVLLGLTVLLLIARQGAQRRATQVAVERLLLERRSHELAEHNRQLEEARTRAERALALAEETNRVRSEFVLMINHELRTPLTAVVTGAELLSQDWTGMGPDDRTELLVDIVADGRRLQQLITQMLAVARIENRSLQYELRPVTGETLRSRVEQLSPRTTLWSSALHVPALLTDVDTLSHLLVSLADNARTHGATTVEITVAEGLTFEPCIEVGRRPSTAAYFLVRDDGPGIDPEFVDRMFEKFEKRGRTSGTGLGLYLARLMIEGIEGSIAVDTGSDGTIMAVAVPLYSRRLRVAS
jgi:signal transduction histidine kinase